MTWLFLVDYVKHNFYLIIITTINTAIYFTFAILFLTYIFAFLKFQQFYHFVLSFLWFIASNYIFLKNITICLFKRQFNSFLSTVIVLECILYLSYYNFYFFVLSRYWFVSFFLIIFYILKKENFFFFPYSGLGVIHLNSILLVITFDILIHIFKFRTLYYRWKGQEQKL